MTLASDALRAAIRIPTVSNDDPTQTDRSTFEQLGALLESTFPLVHKHLDFEAFDFSRLYLWRGVEPNAQPRAILLAHQDVVPVTDPTQWTHPPFSGELADGYIWGRGAIDDKSRVIAILTAVEQLLAADFQPDRSILIAFGHDEEIGGGSGAEQIAKALLDRGVMADLVLDEGGLVGDGLVKGVDRPVGSIMLGEKGFATVELTVKDPGGHASLPPKLTAVGRIAKSVNAIQSHQFPLRLTPTILDMLERVAPFISEPRRTLVRSAHRLGPIVTRLMAQQPETEALVRTTTAPTVIRGGVKDNVLPQFAQALINFRILPGDSVASVLDHCRDVVNDERVEINLAPGFVAEPTAFATGDFPDFELVAQITRELIPDAVVTTGIVTGATDSRHYSQVSKHRLNFAPILLNRSEIGGIHGTDERISLENLQRLVDFNSELLVRL